MDKQTFLNRFLFYNQQLITDYPYRAKPLSNSHSDLKKAAVLIPLVEREGGLNIILTERALHLRHHPGQVSFPGGKQEEHDSSLAVTALRETEEEIGIKQSQVSLFGSLPNLDTVSGFAVSPYLGFVQSDHSLQIDVQEVRAVFEVPVTFLLNKKHFYRHHLVANKKRHFTYCLPYQNRLIWGATAQLLFNLQLQLTD